MLEASLKNLTNRYLKITPDVGEICLNDWKLSLEVLDDPTDTWGHSSDRFDGAREGIFTWTDNIDMVELGPIRKAIRLKGEFGNSRVWARLMIVGDEPILRLRLSVVWAQIRQLLRLRIYTPDVFCKRIDLVSGGFLNRPINGAEFPVSGALIVNSKSGRTAIIAPEIFSGSVDSHNVNLTLLRSPYTAHDALAPAEMRPDQLVTDQGTHEFELLFYPNCGDQMDQIERLAREMEMPPITWDLTG
jgi:alpha-mannosidase